MENKKLNKNFLEWFVGFCDADANFQIFPKKRSYLKKDGIKSEYINIGYGFHISLSCIARDLELIKEIQTKFNKIGHIYIYSDKEECRWAVTKKSELIYLIETVFSLNNVYLITKHQRDRLARLKYVVLNNFNRVENLDEYKKFIETTLDSPVTEINEEYFTTGTAFQNWILGFITGEGSFYINTRGYLVFSIEHTDRYALELLKQNLDLGPNLVDRGTRDETRQRTYSLTLHSKKDILTIKKICENPLLSKLKGYKLKQYNDCCNAS